MNKGYKKIIAVLTACSMVISLSGCRNENEEVKKSLNSTGETITLRILENDTAKKEGYFDELLKAFNEAYADQGIVAVDADMDEYSDLAQNGPYGYGPDVLYQANDILMKYAEDKHILPLNVEELECYSQIPEAAWNAFKISIDGTTYTCGVPVNIQEPMLYYRKDNLPENWEENWDRDKNTVPDFAENWCDLYSVSKELRDNDTSAGHDERYGFMTSFNDLYMNGEFLFSEGAYVFGKNEDGTFNTEDIGFAFGNSAAGLSMVKQFAALMNEGCVDDTITANRYEKLANGTYMFAVSTPDTYVLFLDKLALQYESDGLSAEEALKKAEENLVMTELPGKMPINGDLSSDAALMGDEDWTNTVVMGGVNGYGVSSYTKYREASIAFVEFATGYDMIKLRMDMLGIAPTRSDVSMESGGTTEMIFSSLSEGNIYLMPSVKAINQIWTPMHSLLADVAKDSFRESAGETEKYNSSEDYSTALNEVNKQIYDSIYTLSN